MSTDEEMVARGRLAAEHADVKKKIAILQADALRIGNELVRIGKGLRDVPHLVSVDVQSMESNFHGQRIDFPSAILDAKKISQLTAELREAILKKEQMKEIVKAFGLET
jgi:hypothetical protein